MVSVALKNAERVTPVSETSTSFASPNAQVSNPAAVAPVPNTGPLRTENTFTEQSNSFNTAQTMSGTEWISLKRSGQQPLRFQGFVIAQASGFFPEASMWYEIDIFRNQLGGFVVDVKLLSKLASIPSTDFVRSFNSLEEVASFLERYQPDADIPVTIDTGNMSISTADLALQAVALRQRIEEARRNFQALIGDLLYQLEPVTPLNG